MTARELFPRWFDRAFWAGAICLACGLASALLLAFVLVRSPSCTGEQDLLLQPVLFDHRHHVRDDGIGCSFCHAAAWRSPHAGVPSTALCMGCHAQVWPDSPLLEPVRRSFVDQTPIAWRRVHRLPDFVFFDHRAHVGRGVDCATCHGEVDRMAQAVQVAPLTMAWCLDCHRRPPPHTDPPVHCAACHR